MTHLQPFENVRAAFAACHRAQVTGRTARALDSVCGYRRHMSIIAPSRSSNEAPSDLPVTLGALRATGYAHRTVKDEIRANLIERLSSGDDPFPGIVGFDQTVRPQIERALLAGHDIVLLGERGQGKTRLIRTLVNLLDEWWPGARSMTTRRCRSARAAAG